MFHEVTAVAKYNPSGPRDCDVEQFSERVAVCQGCAHRRNNECQIARQLVTIQARRTASRCPLRLWPGDPSLMINPASPVPPSGSPPLTKGGPGGLRTPGPAPALTAAVIVISHNYGRYLAESVRSVLSQTVRPAEIVIVDDSSIDDTADVAATFAGDGVRYVRIDARNVNVSRRTGFEATTADVVSFLDADDVFPPDYVSNALACFTDPTVAVVRSDMQCFGACRDMLQLRDDADIHWQNYLPACSFVRRSALITVDAFADLPDQDQCRHHNDWAMWRKVLTGTRRSVKQSSVLQYRQHNANWLHVSQQDPTRPPSSYYDRAALALEPITIFSALSGRADYWQDLRQWLERQTFFPRDRLRLVLVDTSQDEDFHFSLRQWASGAEYSDVRTIRQNVGRPGLAGSNARQPDNRQQIIQAMWRIYDRLPSLDTEWILTVEDDVVPPDDVLDRLLRSMDSDVFSVASPYRGRYGGWIAWDQTGHLLQQPRHGLHPTTGNGFGCTLLRRSVLQGWTIGPYGGFPDYDYALYQQLADGKRWRSLIDWDCRSTHAGLAPV